MRKTITRWICDNTECPATTITDEGQTPDRWKLLRMPDVEVCSQSCLDALLNPWYDDLCVEVTLANMLLESGSHPIKNAIVDAVGYSGEFYTHETTLEFWTRANRECYALDVSTGIVTARIGQVGHVHSPHSIVKLICPTFAEACEHPAEFLVMYHAAVATHDKLSDVDGFVAVCQKIDSVCNAVRSASSLRRKP